MPKFERIIITSALHSGGGFAVRSADADQVYIPPSCGPVKDEIVQHEFMALIKEDTREGKVPWRASFVDWDSRIGRDPTPTDALPQIDQRLPTPPDRTHRLPSEMRPEELERRIMTVLDHHKKPLRTHQVYYGVMEQVTKLTLGSERDQQSNCVGRTLQSMHSDGTITRADVFKKANQERVSFYLWATCTDAFGVNSPWAE